jgi:predicted neutral ceramidase superfamily lipid hydrolase
VDDSTRELIIHAFLFLHFLGIASLLAGFLTQMREIKTGMKINAGVFHGAYLMLISGLAMAGFEPHPEKLNVLVISLKSIVLTVIFFVAYMYKKKETPKWVVPLIAGLTMLNMLLAIFGNVAAA